MGSLIKIINKQNLIEFDKGIFDSWCVYLTRPNKQKYAPKDFEYLRALKELGKIYGNEKLYADFLVIYELTSCLIDPNVLSLITTLSTKYSADFEEFDIWFTVIYSGMIAEENKANAILKKRIKRLAIHQILVESLEPEFVANFSKGQEWRVLDGIMKSKGF